MKKPEHTQLNALIPTPMHKELKKQAAEEGRTMADILKDALEAYMKKVRRKR